MKIIILLRLFLLIPTLFISSCTLPSIPLNLHQVSLAENYSSTKFPASFSFIPGATLEEARSETTSLSDNSWITVELGPYEYRSYSKENQRALFGFFKDELERLGIASEVSSPQDQCIVNISLNIIYTAYQISYRTYRIHAKMTIEHLGKSTFFDYKIVSNEGDSWAEKIRTSAEKGKQKVSSLLLEKMIKDTAVWASENTTSYQSKMNELSTEAKHSNNCRPYDFS